MDKVAWWDSVTVARRHHLLSEPLRRRMGRYSGVDDFSRAMIDNEDDIQRPEPNGLNGEQIASPDLLGVLGQTAPPIGRRLTVLGPAHVLGDGAGADSESQLGELRLNPPLAPEGVLTGYSADQGPDLSWNTGPASSSPSP